MENILTEFWYGNVCPLEESYRKTKEIKEVEKLVWKNRDELELSLTQKQKDLLEKYDECLCEMHSLNEMQIFLYAFSLGGRFMLETLSCNVE